MSQCRQSNQESKSRLSPWILSFEKQCHAFFPPSFKNQQGDCKSRNPRRTPFFPTGIQPFSPIFVMKRFPSSVKHESRRKKLGITRFCDIFPWVRCISWFSFPSFFVTRSYGGICAWAVSVAHCGRLWRRVHYGRHRRICLSEHQGLPQRTLRYHQTSSRQCQRHQAAGPHHRWEFRRVGRIIFHDRLFLGKELDIVIFLF